MTQPSRATLSKLMSFIDRHVDDLSDGDYLEFCQMLKNIHNTPETQPQHSITPAQTQNPYFGFSFQQRMMQDLRNETHLRMQRHNRPLWSLVAYE